MQKLSTFVYNFVHESKGIHTGYTAIYQHGGNSGILLSKRKRVV